MASIQRWREAGIDIKTEVSVTGDLIQPYTETFLTLAAGGPSGVPSGWSAYQPNGNLTNMSMSSSANRFAQQCTTPPSSAPAMCGGVYYFPAEPGKIYKLIASVRLQAGRNDAQLFMAIEGFNPNTGFHQPYGGGSVSDERPITDYRRMAATCTQPIDIAAGYTQVRVILASGGVELNTGSTYNWGTEWKDVSFQVQDATEQVRTWRDISCDVQGIQTHYGRERFTNRYDVASVSLLLLNTDGRYSYAEPHPFNFGPGRIIRISATYQSVSYPIYFGVIDTLSDAVTVDGKSATAVSCLDPTSIFSNRQTPSLPAANDADSRLREIALFIGYAQTAFDPGVWQMQDIVANGRSLRDEMGVTADSEGGSVFAAREGTLVYKNRNWITTDDNLTKVTANLWAKPDSDQPYFDGTPTQPGAPEICLASLQTDWSMARVINLVELANAGGTAKTYEDKPSQKQHGPRTYQRNDFVLDRFYSDLNGYLDIRADDIMDGYTQPKMRLNRVTYRPGVDGNDWTWTLRVFLNWLVRVWYQNSRTGYGWLIVTHIQSIEHRITPTEWEVSFALDLPTFYADAPVTDYAYWDTGAKWDTSYVWS